MSTWYVSIEGEQMGPYSMDNLKSLADENQLSSEDLIWSEGMTDWIKPDEHPELAGRGSLTSSHASTSPPPLPGSYSGSPQKMQALSNPSAPIYYDTSARNKAQNFGYLGSLLLSIGVFTPVVSIPIFGNMNYFLNGEGDGVFILILAVISALAVLGERYQILWLTGLGSMGVMGFTLFNYNKGLSDLTSETQASYEDNPFAAMMSEAVAETVQLQWGWFLLGTGVVCILFSAYTARVWE